MDKFKFSVYIFCLILSAMLLFISLYPNSEMKEKQMIYCILLFSSIYATINEYKK